MDVSEPVKALEKKSTIVTTRSPLLPAENKNGTVVHRFRTREISSRYRSPTPSAAANPKRYPSPNARRPSSPPTLPLPNRAISAERKLPSSPSSSPSSTPVKETNANMLLASRKIAKNKLPESLWPSTMRNLSVSFQSDPVKKTVSHTPKKSEISVSRKPTPERTRTPLKGKNTTDHSENSKPADGLNARLLDEHRLPSRKVFSTGRNRSIDLIDKGSKISSLWTNIPHSRRLSLDGASDLLLQVNYDDSSAHLRKDGSLTSSDRTTLVNATARTLSSRGVSPSRAKAVNLSSRGPSSAWVRPSSPSRQHQSSTSVLSFIADIKGKKAANHIEDVHQLRLMYNRHLQWRYANAQTDNVLHFQKVKAEKILYSVWRTIVDKQDSVIEKRMDLQQVKLKLILYSVLENQVTCLDEWASIKRDHTNSLTCAIQDLQASTIRIPVTEGARVEIETVKAAICSAVDVMQAMGSSLCSTLSRVVGMNLLVSELADVAAHERAMLDECESLLGSTTALQVEENSIRTHLLQMKQMNSER